MTQVHVCYILYFIIYMVCKVCSDCQPPIWAFKIDGPGSRPYRFKEEQHTVPSTSNHSHAIVPAYFAGLVVTMSCFRIDLSTYMDLPEAKLEVWARKFFVRHAWKRPLMFGEVVESDYRVQKVQTLVNNNLKNWKATSSKRYNTKWVNRISHWDFAKECPAKKVIADHKLQRLTVILSQEAVGMRALKQHAGPDLAKVVAEKEEKDEETIQQERLVKMCADIEERRAARFALDPVGNTEKERAGRETSAMRQEGMWAERIRHAESLPPPKKRPHEMYELAHPRNYIDNNKDAARQVAKAVAERVRLDTEMDKHKATFGDSDPEGWALLKIKEKNLKNDFEWAWRDRLDAEMELHRATFGRNGDREGWALLQIKKENLMNGLV